jgi:hypothetical protein
MIYKTPSLSDSLIVIALSSLTGLVIYLNKKFEKKNVTEVDKLEEQLKIERLKLNIDQIKENSLREKAIRDSRLSTMGYQEGKKIQF